MSKYDIFCVEYGVRVVVSVHTTKQVVTPFDISISSVYKQGKEVDEVWWDSVNEMKLYHSLCQELNKVF